MTRPFLVGEVDSIQAAVAKHLPRPGTGRAAGDVAGATSRRCRPFDARHSRPRCARLAERWSQGGRLDPRDARRGDRPAVSPGLFEVLELLGRDRSLAAAAAAAADIGEASR